jgi:hypothetical protein
MTIAALLAVILIGKLQQDVSLIRKPAKICIKIAVERISVRNGAMLDNFSRICSSANSPAAGTIILTRAISERCKHRAEAMKRFFPARIRFPKAVLAILLL